MKAQNNVSAKLHTLILASMIIFPAVSYAKKDAGKVNLKSSCEIFKANLKSKTDGWVSVAKKIVTTQPSSGKSKPDIILTADDLQVEYANVVNVVPLKTNEVYLAGAGFLKVKNLRTGDVLNSYTPSGVNYSTSTSHSTQINDASTTVTLGYLNPSEPNSYMISCKCLVNN